MFVNTRYFCHNLVNNRLIQQFLPALPVSIMETSTLKQIQKLFHRLKAADNQAEILKKEVNSIKDEIVSLSESEIFKQHLSSFSDFDESDCPPAKKTKFDSASDKATKFNFTEHDGYVVVYTDGACENNGHPNAKAGLGVWWGENHPLNASEPVQGKATNNVGEIQACVKAVKIAKENDIKKLKICTDSQFTINSMTKWIHGWKKNNWQLAGNKGTVKNKVDFIKLDNLCQTLDVKWQHVAGHAGLRGNEEADRLAREGAKLYKFH